MMVAGCTETSIPMCQSNTTSTSLRLPWGRQTGCHALCTPVNTADYLLSSSHSSADDIFKRPASQTKLIRCVYKKLQPWINISHFNFAKARPHGKRGSDAKLICKLLQSWSIDMTHCNNTWVAPRPVGSSYKAQGCTRTVCTKGHRWPVFILSRTYNRTQL
jgi:hypothetical protein